MKTLAALIACAVMTGCAGQNDILLPDVYPHLADAGSIYYPGSDLTRRDVTAYLLLFVGDRGNVIRVELQRTTGSPALDDTIRHAAMRWKYTPAVNDGKPVAIWISQKISIQFQPLTSLYLSEIVVQRATLADSLRQQILQGSDFEILAKEYSLAASGRNGGSIGKVMITDFQPAIWKSISRLMPGECTEPIPFNHQFAIYKRIR